MMSIAALLHGISWGSQQDAFPIDSGITLCRFEGSQVQSEYLRLCARRGIDSGDPFGYRVYLDFSPSPDDPVYILDYGDPDSTVDRIANMVVLATECPIGMSRVLRFGSDRRRLPETDLVWQLPEWVWALDTRNPWPHVTPEVAAMCQQLWRNARTHFANRRTSRVATALTYFQHSWRSHHVEQACLHLAVALELLFAPHANTETTHQIAFNIAHYMGASASEREDLFDATRAFYRVRSAIVHSGLPEYEDVEATVVRMFPLIAGVLRRILTEEGAAQIFDSDVERRRLFRSFLF